MEKLSYPDDDSVGVSNFSADRWPTWNPYLPWSKSFMSNKHVLNGSIAENTVQAAGYVRSDVSSLLGEL